MTARIAALSLAAALVAAGCNQPLSAPAPAPAAPAAKPEAPTKVKGVPSKLFEIELGKTYHFTDGFTKSDLPALSFHFGRVPRSDNIESEIYFKPHKVYEAFPYTEKSGEYGKSSSYWVRVLRVVPHNATSFKAIEHDRNLDYMVSLVGWSKTNFDRNNEEQSSDYWWAMEMCGVFESDLGTTPKVVDKGGAEYRTLTYSYTCTFEDDDRELVVDSSYGRSVHLTFNKAASSERYKVAEMALRKLQANDIRPY